MHKAKNTTTTTTTCISKVKTQSIIKSIFQLKTRFEFSAG